MSTETALELAARRFRELTSRWRAKYAEVERLSDELYQAQREIDGLEMELVTARRELAEAAEQAGAA